MNLAEFATGLAVFKVPRGAVASAPSQTVETWEAGSDTTESTITAAKLAAAIVALGSGVAGSLAYVVALAAFGVDESESDTNNMAGITAGLASIPAGSSALVMLPSGVIEIGSAYIPFRSNTFFVERTKWATTVTGTGTKVFANSGTGDLTNFGVLGLKTTTTSVVDSGTDGLIYIDGPNVDGFVCNEGYLDVGVAYTNAVFVKTQSGKTVKGVYFERNTVPTSTRMGIEVIDHDNAPSPAGIYNCRNIVIKDNDFAGDPEYYFVSLSGEIDGSEVESNRFNGGSTSCSAVEAVNCRRVHIRKNEHRGSFASLVSISTNGTEFCKGLIYEGNTTVGLVAGRLFFSGAGDAVIDNNVMDITGKLLLSGALTSAQLGSGNHINSTSSVVLEMDSSPNNRIMGGWYGNPDAVSNTSVVRAFGATGTGNVMVGTTIVKGTGGVTHDAVSSGELFAYGPVNETGRQLAPFELVTTWANRPDPTTASGQVILVSDLGYSRWRSNGTDWNLIGSATLVNFTPFGGNTSGNEQTVMSITIPVNALVGIVSFDVRGSYGKNGPNDPTTSVRLYMGSAGTTSDAQLAELTPLLAADRSASYFRSWRVSSTTQVSAIGPQSGNWGSAASTTAHTVTANINNITSSASIVSLAIDLNGTTNTPQSFDMQITLWGNGT